MTKRPIEKLLPASNEDDVLQDLEIYSTALPDDEVLTLLEKYKRLNGGAGLSLPQLKKVSPYVTYETCERLIQRGEIIKTHALVSVDGAAPRWINMYKLK